MKQGSINEVLTSLGVTEQTLSQAEKQALDQEGYVILNNLIDPTWLTQLRATYEELLSQGEQTDLGVHQQEGSRRLVDLVNKGQVFDRVYTHPRLLAAVYHLLRRDFSLFSLNGRDPLPGFGQQVFHSDWPFPRVDQGCYLVNSMWMLDDFTTENGVTRLLPGTQHLKGQPSDYLCDGLATHPYEVLLTGSAGSVAVFNAHIWHGGTQNRTTGYRKTLHCAFVDRNYPQQFNQREYLRQDTYKRISVAARYLLDVD